MTEKQPKNHFEELKRLSQHQREWFIKATELELKEKEIQANIGQHKKWWNNPLYLAVIGLFANFIITWYNGINVREIEDNKSQTTAILDAIRTGDTAQAKINLDFLLKVGLLKDKNGKIKLYLSSDSDIPVLPLALSSSTNPTHVYICESPNAFSYHADSSCRSIKGCLNPITKITWHDAETNYNRRKCKLCFDY